MDIRVLKSFNIENNVYSYTRHLYHTNMDLCNVIYVEIVRCVKEIARTLYAGYAYKDIFDVQNLFYLNHGSRSKYIYLVGDNTKFSILAATKAEIPVQTFPYHFLNPEYNVSTQQLKFMHPVTDKTVCNAAEQLKYTFGIEFETASGVIPEELCYKLGLVPLRDGSIHGVEYATVPLSNKNISLLKQQIECLQTYTTFDETCSMHIHFGRLPSNLKYYYTVYKLFAELQYELHSILPEYTFHTDKYKDNGKNYCALLPEFTDIFNWYFWLSAGTTLHPDIVDVPLRQPHPSDLTGRHKWNIPVRYYAVNFVNALFYNRNKTVEFRFLKPSYNTNYIINWLFLFTSILKTAEKIFTQCEGRTVTLGTFNQEINDLFRNRRFCLSDCVAEAFNKQKTRNCMFQFIHQLIKVTKLQRCVNDYIGMKTQFHNLYFKTNPIDK